MTRELQADLYERLALFIVEGRSLEDIANALSLDGDEHEARALIFRAYKIPKFVALLTEFTEGARSMALSKTLSGFSFAIDFLRGVCENTQDYSGSDRVAAATELLKAPATIAKAGVVKDLSEPRQEEDRREISPSVRRRVQRILDGGTRTIIDVEPDAGNRGDPEGEPDSGGSEGAREE